MSFNTPLQHIPGEADLREHIAGADLSTLLMTTAHLSGDFSILKPQWRPELELSVAVSRFSAHEQQQARNLCLEKLLALRDSGAPLLQRPTFDQLQQVANWVVGEGIESYLPMIAEELSTDQDDLRRPAWHKEQVAPGRDFHVAIIGAGESGIVMALRLKQAGVPFVIYEKGDEVGGTWRDNSYPGCRVDVNSFLYSFSFARKSWKDYFAPQKDVFEYMKEVARTFELYPHIRFGTEVSETRWDETRKHWQLTFADGQSTRANCVVFAVGQLNRPMIPNIAGTEQFQGNAFHSARWDHHYDFTGKRVAVIGTGASAAQFIPQLAKTAEKVTIFSRTTNWLLPTDNLHHSTPDSMRWLLDHLPGYSLWYRASLVIPQVIGIFEEIKVDPDYPPTEVAVSALNENLRSFIDSWMRPQFADRPDLEGAIIPDSPVGGKRIIRDNGTWISTLKRDNVRLQGTAIESITEDGITVVDGEHESFDVIVYGTGFHASKFLMPVNIIGRDGVNLHEFWDDDARAYIGTNIPGFPNLFCMYGPNTNLVVQASIIMFSELTAQYIMDGIRLLLEGGHNAMDVRKSVFDSYNQNVDEANKLRAWGFSNVNSWYKNSKGRVAQNFPYSAAQFWLRTHEVRALEYQFN